MSDGNKEKKSGKLTFIILGIVILILAMGGVALATYTWNYTSKNPNNISTGSISLSLLESTDTISIENALPMSDDKGKVSGEKFDFAVTTEASGNPGDIKYKLSITEVDELDEGYTKLDKSNVKIYLTVLEDDQENGTTETEVVAPTKVDSIITEENGEGTLTFTKEEYLKHTHNEVNKEITTKYRLRMWIADDTDASNWDDSNQKNQYKLKIGASGTIAPIS